VKALAAGLALAAAAAVLLVPPGPRVLSAGIEARDNDYIHDLIIDGHREQTKVRQGLPAWNQPFCGFTRGNGIVVNGRKHVTIRNVTLRNIAGFAILVSNSRYITIDHVRIDNSGSVDGAGQDNTTGGILIEEGTTDFCVTNCELRNIRGNGIWTHSLYTSARNARGLFAGNRFENIGRDALQAGHATEVRVADNSGVRIGYPRGNVEPVAVDTAGNVDRSTYAGNRFRDVNGKCIDLDGFHDGEVRGNTCVGVNGYGIVMNNSNPDMQSRNVRIVDNTIDEAAYGGVFVIGDHNIVSGNKLLNLNRRHQGDPLLHSGIYLGERAERSAPARDNVIEHNEISGAADCVGGAVERNTVRANWCR